MTSPFLDAKHSPGLNDSDTQQFRASGRFSIKIFAACWLVAFLWLIVRVVILLRKPRSQLKEMLGIIEPVIPDVVVDRLGDTWASIYWSYASLAGPNQPAGTPTSTPNTTSLHAPTSTKPRRPKIKQQVVRIGDKLIVVPGDHRRLVISDLVPDKSYKISIYPLYTHQKDPTTIPDVGKDLLAKKMLSIRTLACENDKSLLMSQILVHQPPVIPEKFVAADEFGVCAKDVRKIQLETFEACVQYADLELQYQTKQEALEQELADLHAQRRQDESHRAQLRAENKALEDDDHALEVQVNKLKLQAAQAAKFRADSEQNLVKVVALNQTQLSEKTAYEHQLNELSSRWQNLQQRELDLLNQIREVSMQLQSDSQTVRETKLFLDKLRNSLSTSPEEKVMLLKSEEAQILGEENRQRLIREIQLDARIDWEWARAQRILEQQYVDAYLRSSQKKLPTVSSPISVNHSNNVNPSNVNPSNVNNVNLSNINVNVNPSNVNNVNLSNINNVNLNNINNVNVNHNNVNHNNVNHNNVNHNNVNHYHSSRHNSVGSLTNFNPPSSSPSTPPTEPRKSSSPKLTPTSSFVSVSSAPTLHQPSRSTSSIGSNPLIPSMSQSALNQPNLSSPGLPNAPLNGFINHHPYSSTSLLNAKPMTAPLMQSALHSGSNPHMHAAAPSYVSLNSQMSLNSLNRMSSASVQSLNPPQPFDAFGINSGKLNAGVPAVPAIVPNSSLPNSMLSPSLNANLGANLFPPPIRRSNEYADRDSIFGNRRGHEPRSSMESFSTADFGYARTPNGPTNFPDPVVNNVVSPSTDSTPNPSSRRTTSLFFGSKSAPGELSSSVDLPVNGDSVAVPGPDTAVEEEPDSNEVSTGRSPRRMMGSRFFHKSSHNTHRQGSFVRRLSIFSRKDAEVVERDEV